MRAILKREAARFANTVVWSWAGWRASWRTEATLRQWTIVNILSIALTFAIEMTAVERAMIIGFGLLILVTELLNTAVESAVNRISAEQHPMSKKAKDAGSAAVGLAAITAGIVWLIILIG
jgi:diacylglycerol kinase (ATP)